MSNVPRTTRPRRSMALIALAATLGLAVLALTQCKMVTDRVTGLTMTPGRLSARSSCVKGCSEQFENAFREEVSRHQAALRECGSDQSCRTNENERYMLAIAQLNDARRDCKKNCYNEGGGDSR
jgi:hypothetical protein